ncbi:hypothetical protein K439DRAFT_1634452 [Ramaria rubella]|nr:hypothetical protein K439DRAFT_1634452 [Ramaria rubella]
MAAIALAVTALRLTLHTPRVYELEPGTHRCDQHPSASPPSPKPSHCERVDASHHVISSHSHQIQNPRTRMNFITCVPSIHANINVINRPLQKQATGQRSSCQDLPPSTT